MEVSWFMTQEQWDELRASDENKVHEVSYTDEWTDFVVEDEDRPSDLWLVRLYHDDSVNCAEIIMSIVVNADYDFNLRKLGRSIDRKIVNRIG